jgi:Ala-tRNA(Pro) deacylase
MTSVDSDMSTYHRLIAMLEDRGVGYQVIKHEAEGRTVAASAARGHPPSQAAKCMVVEVRVERYALCVIPGDSRVKLDAVREIYGGGRARLAPQPMAESLTECERGTIIPFSFRPAELEVIADPGILEQGQIYFNAARLDRSLAMSVDDFMRVARPRLAVIAELDSLHYPRG